jgi:hypothetical protein
MFSATKLYALRIGWMLAVGGVIVVYSALNVIEQGYPEGIVLLDQLGPGYRAFWVLGIAACVCLVLSIPLRRAILYTRQERHDVAARRLLEDLRAGKAPECKEFFVYLRSFETTGRLKPPFFFTVFVFERLHTNELESFLALALEKQGPVVALGVPEEAIGAARILDGEASWKADIQMLLRRAAGVLVLPSAHEGTKWEIQFLKQENLLSKCVLLMPPRTRQFDWRSKWEQAAQALQQYSITLPEYNERGLLFTLDEAGKVADARVFSLFQRRSLRKSVVALLRGPRTGMMGEQAIQKALRRSRVLWFVGKWGFFVGPVASVAYFLWLLPWSGHTPKGVNPPPPWSTFLARYDSADALNSGQGQADWDFLRLRYRKVPESEIDQLARKGLGRIGDQEREVYSILSGEILLGAPNEHVCAALADGRAIELERIRTLVNFPAPALTLWLQLREQAAMAKVRNQPAVASDELSSELRGALFAALGQDEADELLGLMSTQRALTDHERCQIEVEGDEAVDKLQEPYKAQFARLLAKHAE